MKLIAALTALISLSVIAQSDRDLELCYSAASKEATKIAKKINDVKIGYDYCQPTSQGVVDSNGTLLVIRNWVSCHYGQARVIDVELVLKKSWFSGENVCKVRNFVVVTNN